MSLGMEAQYQNVRTSETAFLSICVFTIMLFSALVEFVLTTKLCTELIYTLISGVTTVFS